ncbi:MAG: glycoside hydrolase family 2 TIM barrel-domain containing protein [Verrucomicrobiota bacterium]
MRRDIELSLEAGFNGARLHQKVFEERFLHYADKLGYLVWGEFPDWGCSDYGTPNDHQKPGSSYVAEWIEALQRDYSHPSIIGWCPLNETWQILDDHVRQLDDTTRAMFLATKALDSTRPVLDTSGYSHRVLETDIYDSHDYEQDPEQFFKNQAGLAQDKPFINPNSKDIWSLPLSRPALFCERVRWDMVEPGGQAGEDSWGYGQRPRTTEEFYERFLKLCAVLLDNSKMFGYCYTQLTDVFQEQNGIYFFDRSSKFDLKRIRAAQQKTRGHRTE